MLGLVLLVRVPALALLYCLRQLAHTAELLATVISTESEVANNPAAGVSRATTGVCVASELDVIVLVVALPTLSLPHVFTCVCVGSVLPFHWWCQLTFEVHQTARAMLFGEFHELDQFCAVFIFDSIAQLFQFSVQIKSWCVRGASHGQ